MKKCPVTAPPCPACPEGRGAATAMAIKDHTRTLHFRCRTCAHEWDQTFIEGKWQATLAVSTDAVNT
jgi:hypothetical protein